MCVCVCKIVLTFVLLLFFYLKLNLFGSRRQESLCEASTLCELILEFFV